VHVNNGVKGIMIHPGEVLDEEFLKPANISHLQLANAIGVTSELIDAVCCAHSDIDVDLAFRLGRALSTSATFWYSMQTNYNLSKRLFGYGHEKFIEEIENIKPLKR